QTAGLSGPVDIVNSTDKQIAVLTYSDPTAEMGKHPEVLLDALLSESDIDDRDIDSARTIQLKLRQEVFIHRPQWHASVVVPYQTGCHQRSSHLAHIHRHH